MFIFDFTILNLGLVAIVLGLSTISEMSGTIAVANDPINVLGIIINGKAIPDAIPNKLIARASVKPLATSLNGIIIAIANDPRDDAVRIAVTGVDDFNSGMS